MRSMGRGLGAGRRRIVARRSNDFDLGGVREDQGFGFRSTNGDYVIRSNSVAKRDPRDQGRKRFEGYKLGGFDFLDRSKGVMSTRGTRVLRRAGRAHLTYVLCQPPKIERVILTKGLWLVLRMYG